ncbi:hypothetical protein GO684_04180 [Wolbachia endosymbiont of Litomosoides brasiliensis]|nr:hypothetical protein [Wolbachia endosymbiont of Litomosoides brasiliensis]
MVLARVSSIEDLKFCLHTALFNQSTEFLSKLFSKFKSSKDKKFDDCINEMRVQGHLPLGAAINSYNIDLVGLFLENSANSNVKIFLEYTSIMLF